jgi:MFS family permease
MSLLTRWASNIKEETHLPWRSSTLEVDEDLSLGDTQGEAEPPVGSKSGLGKYWAIVAAGAGLFSDGYVNNSIGSVNTILALTLGSVYTDSSAQSNVASIAFAGTVFGQLLFAYIADYHSRKLGMLASTTILIVFTILAAGSWGADGGSGTGMLEALVAYRFLIGIGIGGEYPAGSVACAEATTALGRGKRNRWFVFFTNFMIDSGFVVSAFVPLVLLWIFGMNHLVWVWRLTLGLGAIPPISLFILRTKFKDNEQFKKNNMKRARVPYWLVLKFYGPRLIVVALIWFMYDFSSYSFGIYSSQILATIIPGNDLYQTFGWNTVFNLFYIPGSFLGAFCSDYLGPRLCLAFGVGMQGIIGFIMAGAYDHLSKHVAAFTVVFGIFTTLGEFGPGDQIGLIASKTSATPIRGQYYGIAAAIGKIGAYVGTKVFPIIIKNAGGSDTTKGNQAPFWVSSSLCIFSAILTLFFVPALTQDSVTDEDIRFRNYLEDHGFDISLLGDTEFLNSSANISSGETVSEKANLPYEPK